MDFQVLSSERKIEKTGNSSYIALCHVGPWFITFKNYRKLLSYDINRPLALVLIIKIVQVFSEPPLSKQSCFFFTISAVYPWLQ